MSMFHGEGRFFGPTKVQEAYNIMIFWFLMENSILKIFGSVDIKITPDFVLKNIVSSLMLLQSNFLVSEKLLTIARLFII